MILDVGKNRSLRLFTLRCKVSLPFSSTLDNNVGTSFTSRHSKVRSANHGL